jgi:energy-coupling factor transporter ATP-binding protein EcfA2
MSTIELAQQTLPALDDRPRPTTPRDTLLSNMDLPFSATFYPLGYAVEIISNDRAVLEAANESFSHSRFARAGIPLKVRIGVSESNNSECPPEPTRREYNHLYSLVADTDNQALLDLNTCTAFVWLTKTAVNNRIYLRYNFLEKVVYLLLGASVVTDLHAACVSKNGKGILLCGDSGAGKSTLAYACARAGWTYTSDDTSYLINSSEVPRIIGHSHRVRFRPAAKTLFPELNGRELTPRLEGKPSLEVPLSELPGLIAANEATVHSIIYLNRYASASGRLVLLPEGTATQRTRKELYSAGEIRTKHEKILDALSAIPTYELRYCELKDAIDQLELLTREK